MNKILLYTLLLLSSSVYIECSQERTDALHAEVKNNKNPIITQETHPILYAMVETLAAAAQVDMPRYISIYSAEGSAVSNNGTIYKTIDSIGAWVDICGDLYICYEILNNLPYEVVEGVISVAIAEKATKQAAKLAAVGCGTFALTVATIYSLNKYYNLNLGSCITSILCDRHSCSSAKSDVIQGLFSLLVFPAILAMNIASNNFQKSIDIKATQLTDAQQVIDGINGIIKLEDTYIKESIFSRIASALKLKSLYNFLILRRYCMQKKMLFKTHI